MTPEVAEIAANYFQHRREGFAEQSRFMSHRGHARWPAAICCRDRRVSRSSVARRSSRSCTITTSGISAASMRRRKLLKERLSCITNEENARRAGNSGGLAMSYKLALAGAGLALSLLMDSANANTVTIQLQQDGVNGGAITTVATGDGSASVNGLTYGTFTSIFVNGVDEPTGSIFDALFSNVIAASSTPGTLTVYVQLSDAVLSGFVRSVTGPALSSFTSNSLPPNWTVKEEAYFISPHRLSLRP
jgi:hypothetical protein